MKNIDKLIYTVKHKIAFIQTAKKLRGYVKVSDIIHDTDKIFLYLTGLNPKTIQKLHRKYSKHHINNGVSRDIESSIIDFECARITKPDKPLNARETILKFYPEIQKEGFEVCDKWCI